MASRRFTARTPTRKPTLLSSTTRVSSPPKLPISANGNSLSIPVQRVKNGGATAANKSATSIPRRPSKRVDIPSPPKDKDSATSLQTPPTPPKTPKTPSTPGTPKSRKSFCAPSRTSIYANPHVAEPCTSGALSHRLEGCGHLVLTGLPEVCGYNCRVSTGTKYTNPRDLDQGFACPACIDKLLSDMKKRQQEAMQQEVEAIKTCMGNITDEYIGRRKHAFARESQETLDLLVGLGRPCCAVEIVGGLSDRADFAAYRPAINGEGKGKRRSDSSQRGGLQGNGHITTSRIPLPKRSRSPRPRWKPVGANSFSGDAAAASQA